MGKLNELLGKDAEFAAQLPLPGHPQGIAPPARPRRGRSHLSAKRPQPARAGESAAAGRLRPAARTLATCRSCPSTRASSTRPARPSPRIPQYFDPENIVKLAIEGGCNAVASTFGVLGHRRPQVRPQDSVHREDQSQRAAHLSEQVRPGDVRHGAKKRTTWAPRPSARRSTSAPTKRLARSSKWRTPSPAPTSSAWRRSSGATCAINAFKADKDYHVSADLTGQANHLGVTIQADIIKQKLPENNGGYNALKFGKTSPLVYEKLTTDHPIDLCRYQVANCYMGRCGLINSGGASSGAGDLAEAVRTAVINKRAGGMGLISGRKAFQRPMAEGVALLNAIQDVYLDPQITVA